jgi:microcystin-dependent protein
LAQPYIGEVRMFAGNFAPAGWMFCEGQTISISENESLFQLIGTTYGGDGESSFALPNLAGRIPIHMGQGPDGTTYQLAEMAGTEQETLTIQQMPAHSHTLLATSSGGTISPANALLTRPTGQQGVQTYAAAAQTTALNTATVQGAGGNQPHANLQPYLCVNFIISMFGIFPSPT